MGKLRLVRFKQDCYRMGELSGLFVVGEDGWDKLQSLIKDETEIHFGEILGKHSEVEQRLTAENITMVTDDQSWILKAQELGIEIGYNPLDYLREDEDEDE